ncbi:MAG: response regulator [Desulfobulbaceae bacterium]|nr:response regulator [Desulfobulbaceae bacterium]
MKENQYKILIVEDNQAMRKLLESMLYGLDYTNLMSAGDGAAAWKIIQEESIDIVLCDLLMPVMNGLELLHKIRASKEFYNLPFIMITGADNQSEIMYTLQAEVDYYILKPPNVGKLDDFLKKVIRQKMAPTMYEKAVTAGKFYYLNNNGQKALKCFDVATRHQPENPMPYYYMGLIYKKDNDFEKAIEVFNKCVSLSRLYVNALIALAEIHNERNDDKILAKILAKVVLLIPDKLEMQRNLGAAYGRLGETEKAAHHLKTAVRLAKNDKEILKNLVEDFIDAGLYDEADDLFLRKFGEDDKEKIVRFWNRLGFCCKEKGNPDKAKYFYMSALGYLPQHKSTNLNLAFLLMEDKEYDGARAYLNKVLRLSPDCPETKELEEKLNKLQNG